MTTASRTINSRWSVSNRNFYTALAALILIFTNLAKHRCKIHHEECFFKSAIIFIYKLQISDVDEMQGSCSDVFTSLNLQC